ncbi:MAG: phosphatase PAP2 family protein [Firmicutes bacterium]|jgi:diacylglycerol kinase (ATP)|nr:phosphatase PAP2 family protein [Bacillota bacterium]
MSRKFRADDFAESLNYAVAGLVYAFRTQRHLRAHFFIAVLVVLLAIAFDLERVELALLTLTIGVVIICELVNTSVEAVVDLITEEYHPLAAIAKNVAASAVLMAAITSLVIGYLIFFDRVAVLQEGSWSRALATPPLVTLAALLVVLIVVLAMKAGGSPVRMQGGMPSAHAAIASVLTTSILFVSHSGTVSLLAVLLTVLVAQSRVEAKIHTVSEVLVGGVIGLLVTALAFQLIS